MWVGQMRSIPNRDSDEAIREFCAVAASDSGSFGADIAITNRRMTDAERRTCNTNRGLTVEIKLSGQAVLLARSKLYGPVNLSIRDLFLALAAEVPDPDRPLRFMPNPNRYWSQVNSSLEREPIEFVGPPPGSITAEAFKDLLFTPGCESLPATAELKSQERHDAICRTFRTDGVYSETPESAPALVQRLSANPNMYGLVGYAAYMKVPEEDRLGLLLTSLGGLQPANGTVLNDAYPASRTFYLYANRMRQPWVMNFLVSAWAWVVANDPEGASLIPSSSDSYK
jgi:phosphate transport system substrate-binding protein